MATAAWTASRDAFNRGGSWFDSERILQLSLSSSWTVRHLLLGVGILCALITVAQELIPVLRREGGGRERVPDEILEEVRSLPRWRCCTVTLSAESGLHLASSRRRGRSRVALSRGLVSSLSPEELRAVIRHEHAHWRPKRRLRIRTLFGLRLIQLFNPVALLAFRELTFEEELACDAEAARTSGSPRPLARALLAFYQDTSPSDPSSRSALRRRIDVLRGRVPYDDEGLLPGEAPVVTAAILGMLLTWIV